MISESTEIVYEDFNEGDFSKNDPKNDNKILNDEKNKEIETLKELSDENLKKFEENSNNKVQEVSKDENLNKEQNNQENYEVIDQTDHNYDQKRFKSDTGEIPTTLTGSINSMNCQTLNENSSFHENHQKSTNFSHQSSSLIDYQNNSPRNYQNLNSPHGYQQNYHANVANYHQSPIYHNLENQNFHENYSKSILSPKSNEMHPKYQESHQTSEDSGEWSSLSPSIESCDDENSFTESQPQNYNNFYHQPQNQNWQYQNYLQNQSHYGFAQPQYSNYSYNYYQEPTTISYVQSPSNLSCEVCVRVFKTSSNLTRHLASKTHLKKLSSKKKLKNTNFNISDVKFESIKKSQGSVTDLSDDEKKILWQIDDEIFEFLKNIENEKIGKKIEIYPTPPLSP